MISFLKFTISSAMILIFLFCSSERSTGAQTKAINVSQTGVVAEMALLPLKGSVHPLARPELDRGTVTDTRPLRRLLLVLQRDPEQEIALQELIEGQRDGSSPNYHAWLKPEQFGKQFGPADEAVQKLTEWLASHRFGDIKVSAGRTVIEFSGTVASVREAFHTEIHRYLVNGEEHFANASDLQIPASLRPLVAGVVSLHDFRRKPMYHLVRISQPAKFAAGSASRSPEYSFNCIDYLTSIFGQFSGQSPSCHAIGPLDFASIYNVLPLWNANPPIDGTGQTIAIVGRTNIDLQDVSDFRNLFGLPPNPPQVILDGADPGLVSGDELEADLDVEWSGAVAKGATIKLVVSESTETTDGVDLSALYIVDHNLAPVMSTSYGQCELFLGTAGNQFYYNLWQQAAAQGITAFVSSGDNGSAGCDSDQGPGPQPAQDGLQVNGLASTPYNVAVGGTDFNDYFNASTYWSTPNNTTSLESAKGYIPEIAWNNSCTNTFLENPALRLSTNAETNCNNSNVQTYFTVPVGGSGGKSNCTSPSSTTVASCAGGYSKPSWQVSQGVPNDGKRDIPDVSLFAGSGFMDNFYMMCEADFFLPPPIPCSAGHFVGIGGTSASAPAFAGLMALINQKTGSRQGNANPIFYSLAARQAVTNCDSSSGPAAGCVFNDITAGTIAMPCAASTPNCTTTGGGDSVGILSGYPAATGYDLATGLGSVNAANLVNGWNSASAGTTSTTSLTLNGGSAVTVTHGTPVTVAVSVSPTSPQATGLASLVATQGGESSGLDTLTLNNGSASGTTNMLPGGASYSVKAHYAGDANYGESDSNPVTVTVNPEPSVTSVHVAVVDLTTGKVSNTNATSIPYGSIYTLRADITNTLGEDCFDGATGVMSYGCPTGTVSLTLDGTSQPSGPLPLNSEGYAENQSIQLTGGPHTFKGSYSGDNSYLPSSGMDSVNVTPAPTLTGTQTLYPMPIGVPIGFSVSARSNNLGLYGAPMTGTFAIFDGSNPVSVSEYTLTGVIYPPPCSPCPPPPPYVWETLDGEITATFSGTPGVHTLTVKYSGDANYSPSSTTASANLVYVTQTTVSSSVPTVPNGQPVTFTAQVIPGQNASAFPTGSVSFNINGNPAGTVSLAGNRAQLTTSNLYAGSVPVSANYSGDPNYGASTGTFTEIVTQVSTSMALTSSNATVTAGEQVTLTAKVTANQVGAAPLTGTVQFLANGTSLGVASVSNNQAKLTPFLNTAGSLQIQAAYSGDQNYSASSATLAETVTPAPPDFSIVPSSPTTVTVSAGQTATFANAISVSGLNGFASPVSLTCSLSAIATICVVSPNTLSSGSGTVTVTVTTTARGTTAPLIRGSRQDLRQKIQTVDLCLITLLLFLVGRLRCSRQSLWRSLPIALTGIALILGALGCGGSGGGGGGPAPPPQTGTRAGTYTVTVTGVSGSTTHSTMLSVIVN
jgi:hypothetical protein